MRRAWMVPEGSSGRRLEDGTVKHAGSSEQPDVVAFQLPAGGEVVTVEGTVRHLFETKTRRRRARRINGEVGRLDLILDSISIWRH